MTVEPGAQRGATLPNPIGNILRLSVGDFLAKTLSFLAFVYLARVLGVLNFGVLEFANALLMYFLLLSDAGLEAWATREAAQARDLQKVAGRVLPLRFLFAGIAFALLLAMLPWLPNYPALRWVMGLFGLSLFAQAASLKWVFLGEEKLARVGAGLVVAQIIFAVAVLAFIRSPAGVVWVPVLRLLGDLAMAVYFGRMFVQKHGGLKIPWVLRGAREILFPSLSIGISQAMGLLNYNFDSVLLGFLKGARVVGWYNAAYRPINIILAVPVSYFTGLFPALSRAHVEGPEAFRELVSRSQRLASIYAVPLGVGGMLLAEPVVGLFFGSAYSASVAPLKILVWSAVINVLRGSYRFSLRATRHQNLDLFCAITSAGFNVGLNILLIPRYGMLGAAAATLSSESVWFLMSSFYFQRAVAPLSPLAFLARPLLAGAVMAACLLFTQPIFWVLRALLAMLVYFSVLLILGEKEIRSVVQLGKKHLSQ